MSADPLLRPGAPVDIHRPYEQELSDGTAPDLAIVIGGALAISTPAGQLPPWDPRIEALIGGADAPGEPTLAMAELESSFFDPRGFSGYPYPWGKAPVYGAVPGIAADLRHRGLSMLARANAHALDWGPEGMRATGAALDEAGLYHAGAGEREGLARMAAYTETADGGGRVALVAAALGFRPTTNALSEHGAAPGRPGVSALACALQRLVPADRLDELRRVSCYFRHPEDPARCDLSSPASAPIFALGSRFSVADTPAANYTSRCEFDGADSAALLRSLREARQDSDFVALLLGGSLPGHADAESSTPPPGLVQLAHAAVDAGAGIVAMTGGAGVGPIEIYRSGSGLVRPILYRTGYLYWSPAAAPPETPDSWQSILVRSRGTANELNVEIYPLDLRSSAGTEAGTPRLADREVSRAILGTVQERSASFGTKVQIEAYGDTLRGRIIVAPVVSAAAAAPAAAGGAEGRE